jgi:hypothetical protein
MVHDKRILSVVFNGNTSKVQEKIITHTRPRASDRELGQSHRGFGCQATTGLGRSAGLDFATPYLGC